MWTASQLNRNALNKEHVDWSAIADSAKKIMVSDFVVLLLQTLAEKKKRQARLWIAKSRFGPDKLEIPVRLDWSRSIIRDA